MKSYYQQIKSAVLPRLTHYKNDLLEIDRKALRGYTGLLIHGSRSTGTDLVLVDTIDSLKSFECACVFLLRSSNDLFLIGNSGKVEPASRDRVINLIKRNLINIARQIANKESPADKVPGDYWQLKRDIGLKLRDILNGAIRYHARRVA